MKYLGLFALYLIVYFLYSIDDKLNRMNGHIKNVEHELIFTACKEE